MKTLTFFLFFLASVTFAQTNVSGKVTDQKGRPIAGANIYIDGTYDGATSDANGAFTFTTSETGVKTLIISFLAFDTFKMEIDLENFTPVSVKLRESINTLDAVVINAGTLEAGDKARVSVLKPLDIVTTAGSAGNIVAALQTLPGTQTVGEDGRLFVRGGEADEAQTYVDGLRVAQPYGARAQDLPTRGRFSPFLFSGISFSTGGYSAEYGEALSSVLLLNTEDEPAQDMTNISLMTVGLGIGHTKKWEKRSFSLNAAYMDLAPYQVAIPQNIDWNRPFQSASGEAVYREHFESGNLKVYANFDASRFDVNQSDINTGGKNRINLENNNLYVNASYDGNFIGNWDVHAGASYGLGKNDIYLNYDNVDNDEHALHLKFKVSRRFSDRFRLSAGADYFRTDFTEAFRQFQGINFQSGYQTNLSAAYTEADVFFTKKFALKAGVRAQYNDLLQQSAVSPRASLAYKFGKMGQVAFAFGDFAQAPGQEFLRYSDYHRFDNQMATHYILNYQFSRDKQTLRLEAYYKDYRKLVRFDTQNVQWNSGFSNDGYGYAKGLELFWRDGRTFRNFEYWLSYSFIDSERLYRNFPEVATPNFVANHNVSLVGKYWIDSLRSQLGVTQSFATGRPFTDLNRPGFQQEMTKAYNSLSLSWAYLLSQQKILYFSVSNVLGTRNVFNYEYATTPGADGMFARREVIPTADRFFFVGFFWTISADGKKNQLEQL